MMQIPAAEARFGREGEKCMRWLFAAAVCGTMGFFSTVWTLVHPQLGLVDLAALAGFGWCLERCERS